MFVLTDLFISRNVSFATGLKLLLLGVPNILALTLPIGTLFAVLMTSARWAADSELVAMQACGVSLRRVARPLVGLAVVVFGIDLVLVLAVMPRANAHLSEVTRQVAFSAATAAVEQRVFAEDFPNQLLYVDKIDRGTGRWHGVILFDLTDPLQESLVTADSGDLFVDARDGSAWLNLQDTTTHQLRPNEPDSYRKNDNTELRIRLRQPSVDANQRVHLSVRETLTTDLISRLRAGGPQIAPEDVREAGVELNKRVAIPAAAVVFAFVGFPLGIRNRRGGRGFGLTASVAIVVAYYVMLNNGELLATGGKVPVMLGMWMPNLVLLALASVMFRRVSRGEKTGAGSHLIRHLASTRGQSGRRAVPRAWPGRRGFSSGLPTARRARLGRPPGRDSPRRSVCWTGTCCASASVSSLWWWSGSAPSGSPSTSRRTSRTFAETPCRS